MEKGLKDVQWGEFEIRDLFQIKSGKRLVKSEMKKGKTPFIGASDSNNGITGFISNSNNSKDSNILGVNYNGSVGEVFYHEYEAIFSDDVKRFSLKNIDGNKYLYLFLKTVILKQKNKYKYGYKFNETRMNKQKIFLPINSEGKPDYEFMESYMRELEYKKIEAYESRISLIISGLDVKTGGVNRHIEKEWREFKIGDLFEKLEQGKSKGLNHLKKTSKGINYLGATNLHNGVLCQVEPVKKQIHKGNCIAFIRNGEGSMGYSVYKAEDFIATSDMSIGYSSFLNRYNGMFITTVADRVRGKYNFGYKRSGERLKKESLLLPINSEGQPDYEYMENYMRRVEYQKLDNYLRYLEKY